MRSERENIFYMYECFTILLQITDDITDEKCFRYESTKHIHKRNKVI